MNITDPMRPNRHRVDGDTLNGVFGAISEGDRLWRATDSVGITEKSRRDRLCHRHIRRTRIKLKRESARSQVRINEQALTSVISMQRDTVNETTWSHLRIRLPHLKFDQNAFIGDPKIAQMHWISWDGGRVGAVTDPLAHRFIVPTLLVDHIATCIEGRMAKMVGDNNPGAIVEIVIK